MRAEFMLIIVLSVLLTVDSYAEIKLTKAKWKQAMNRNLPDKLCGKIKSEGALKPDMEKDCMRLTRKYTEVCLKEFDSKFPANFDEGLVEKWAPIVAKCVSADIVNELKK